MSQPDEPVHYYPFAIAQGIIKWLRIDADEDTEFICLARADYDAFRRRCAELEQKLATIQHARKQVTRWRNEE